MVPIPDEMPSVSTVETQKTGSCVEGKLSDDQSIKNVAGEKKQIMIIKETSNPIVKSERIDNTEKEDTNEIRVRDELSKENIESELKEQSQLEDRMKANEAIERNTQNAKEARMRAEVRTQKEAKQKESVSSNYLSFIYFSSLFFSTTVNYFIQLNPLRVAWEYSSFSGSGLGWAQLQTVSIHFLLFIDSYSYFLIRR